MSFNRTVVVAYSEWC